MDKTVRLLKVFRQGRVKHPVGAVLTLSGKLAAWLIADGGAEEAVIGAKAVAVPTNTNTRTSATPVRRRGSCCGHW